MTGESRDSLLKRIEELEIRLAESEQLIEAIKEGEVDAFAIRSNNQSEIFTLHSGDYAYRILIEKFGEGALNLSEEGIIVYSNPYFTGMIKQSPTGTTIFEYIHPDSKGIFDELFRQALSGNNSRGEINLLIKNVSVPVYVSLTSLQPILPTVGMVITDLTEKKRYEKMLHDKNAELENTQSFLQTMLDTSIEQISTIDKNLVVTSVNKKAAEYYGVTKDALLGKHVFDILPKAKDSVVEKNIRAALNGETVHEAARNSIHKDGFVLETYYIPLILNNVVEGVLIITKDISPVVLVANQLRHANYLLAQAQQIAHIGSWEWKLPSNEIMWSDELYRIYGLDKEKFTPDFNTYIDKIHPEDKKFVNDTINKAMTNNHPLDFFHRIIRPDGEERIIHGRGEVLRDANNNITGMAGTAQDVTASRRAKARLMDINNELEQKNAELENIRTFLESVLDSSVEIISVMDKDLNYTSVNKKFEEFLGVSKEQYIGKNILDIYPKIKESVQFEYICRALKGESLHVPLVKSFAREEKILESYFLPLMIQNKIEGVVVIARDLTEMKIAAEKLKVANEQLELKNQELEESNTELASFTYIASHDLQEPLRKIQTFSNRILDKEYQNFSDTTKNYFERISAASSRMQNLITALLNYSRTNTTEIKFVETNLNNVVEEVKSNLSELIREKNVTIISENLPVIPVVPHQVYQLFLNFITNAIKYSKPEEPPVIQISSRRISSAELLNDTAPKGTDYVELKFKDNGIGFEQQYADKIFELFQRLHTNYQYEGTGIGLAICKRIVQNHKGFIKANSQPGVGSEFNVYLPFKPAV